MSKAPRILRAALRRWLGPALLAAVFVAPLPLAAADLVSGGAARVPQPARVFVRQDVYEETLVLSPPPAVRGQCGRACGAGQATRIKRTAKERYWSRGRLVAAPTVRVVSAAPIRAARIAPVPQPRARPITHDGARCLLPRCDP